MGRKQQMEIEPGRRTFILGLVAAAVLLCSGCARLRAGSELEQAYADLNARLEQAGTKDPQQLTRLAREIRNRSTELLANYNDFVRRFNQLASDRSVGTAQLQQLVADYEAERLQIRHQLLELQDQLHAALPNDAWPEVQKILNRKGRQLTSPNRGA